MNTTSQQFDQVTAICRDIFTKKLKTFLLQRKGVRIF